MSEFFDRAILLSFPAVGCCFLAGGLIWRRHLQRRVAGFVHTYGTVVSHVACTIASDGPVYRPIVEFKAERRVYSVEGSVGSSTKKEEGTKVEVMYDPDFPGTAHLVADYYFAANVVSFLGGAFLLFGMALVKVLWNAPAGSSGESAD